MSLFTQNMLEMAVEIAAEDPTYQELAAKFFDHFLFIARAMNRPGQDGMWDEQDGFYSPRLDRGLFGFQGQPFHRFLLVPAGDVSFSACSPA